MKINFNAVFNWVTPWSSLIEGLWLPDHQTYLVIALYTLSLLFCKLINTTAYHLGRYEPSSPVSCCAPRLHLWNILQYWSQRQKGQKGTKTKLSFLFNLNDASQTSKPTSAFLLRRVQVFAYSILDPLSSLKRHFFKIKTKTKQMRWMERKTLINKTKMSRNKNEFRGSGCGAIASDTGERSSAPTQSSAILFSVYH